MDWKHRLAIDRSKKAKKVPLGKYRDPRRQDVDGWDTLKSKGFRVNRYKSLRKGKVVGVKSHYKKRKRR